MLEISMFDLDEILDNVKYLKSLSFESILNAASWANVYGVIHNMDDKEGYIDFNYENLSCSFCKKEDGYWVLTGSVDVYDSDLENIIMEITV